MLTSWCRSASSSSSCVEPVEPARQSNPPNRCHPSRPSRRPNRPGNESLRTRVRPFHLHLHGRRTAAAGAAGRLASAPAVVIMPEGAIERGSRTHAAAIPAASRRRMDPIRLDQVVMNLLSNASKFGLGKPTCSSEPRLPDSRGHRRHRRDGVPRAWCETERDLARPGCASRSRRRRWSTRRLTATVPTESRSANG